LTATCGLRPSIPILEEVFENTEFTPRLAAEIETLPAPDRPVVELVRRLDPLRIHEKEIRGQEMKRGFAIS
jgi:glutaconate CoA-transferase, subunit B